MNIAFALRHLGVPCLLLALLAAGATSANAGNEPRRTGSSPDSVDNRLEQDRAPTEALYRSELLRPYFDFKKTVAESTGLQFGLDYTALYLDAVVDAEDDDAGSGMVRFFGSWDFFGRGTTDTGGLRFKVEHRHGYTDIAPTELSLAVGNVGVIGGPFSDQEARLTNLYWRQSFAESRVVTWIGLLDATDYVDTFALGSPWTGFTNLAFSTGSASMSLPNEAALGAMLSLWPTDQIYVIGTLTDLNSDPTEPFEGFGTFFDENEYYSAIEIGWTESPEEFLSQRVHVTLWHTDSRNEVDQSEGWGINASAVTLIADSWMPFLRGGWADDGGSLLEGSVSAGLGYQGEGGRDVIAAAVNWGRPNGDTFGPGLDDQWSLEAFYRLQATEELAITPDVQLLINPALNPDEDTIFLWGVRARLAL